MVMCLDNSARAGAAAAGSPVKDGALLRAVSYPDGASRSAVITALNAATTGDFVATTCNAAGLTLTKTDQRGVVHTYAYDDLGRPTSDAVTTLPAGVDGAVRRIERAYDDAGRTLTLTSYAAAVGGSVVNQVKYWYDGWSNVVRAYQAHGGVVDDDGLNGNDTPYVGYTYADGTSDPQTAEAALYVRLAKVTYPAGREVFYNYGTSGSIADALSRSDNIAADSSGTTKYAQYTYLGASTIVKVAHPAVSGGLNLTYGTGGTYAGFDRFGRVIDQRWEKDNQTVVDRYTYGYDMNSNRLTRANLLNGDFDEAYQYDNLNRLVDFVRGDDDATQTWDLDQLGNWSSTTIDSVQQDRTHNAANEITGIDSDDDHVGYDAAGNMTNVPVPADQANHHYVMTYDAWNRLTKAETDAPTPEVVAEYAYDGLGRRIRKTVGEDTLDFYQNGLQTVEVRKNDDARPLEQFIWDIRYQDSPVARFYDSNTDGDYSDGGDNVLYAMNDANFNVTGIVDAATGTVVERYVYSPYGVRTILTGAWGSRSVSSHAWSIAHQGLLTDEETQLLFNQARIYAPALGRALQRDPAGYMDGLTLYEYEKSNPGTNLDPSGASVRQLTVKMYRIIKGIPKPVFVKKISVERAKRMAKIAAKRGGDRGKVIKCASKKQMEKMAEGYGTVQKHAAHVAGGDPHLHSGAGGHGAVHWTYEGAAIIIALLPGSDLLEAKEIIDEVDAAVTSKWNDVRTGWRENVAQRTGLSPEEVSAMYPDNTLRTAKEQQEDEAIEKWLSWTENESALADKYYSWAIYDWSRQNKLQGDYNFSQYELHEKNAEYNAEQLGKLLDVE